MATARAKTGPRRDSAGASAMATPRARTGPRRDSASASTMATPAARTSFGPAGDLDAVTRRRVRDLRLGKTHEAAEHEGRRCPPLWVAPTARYFWLPESLGGGSSLALQHEERPACMNDLVLDLVMVYVISNIVAQGDAIVERERNINVTLSQTLLSPSSDEHINPPQFLAFKTMIEMLIIYVPIYFHWWSLSRTENAFGRDDVVHTCKWVVNMLLLVQLAGWLQVCREEQICGNYAGWMSAGKFFHVICLQYYRAYNHAHHSFQLHEESLYGGFVACGWMTLSFAMPVDASSDETLAWIHAALLSLAVLDLLRFADLLPFNSMRSVFGMCANVCSSRSRRHAPMNLPLLVERQNLFAILCLGEMAVTILAHPWFEMQSEEAKQERGSLGRFAKISSFLLVLLMIRFEILDDGEKPGALTGGRDEGHMGFRHAFNASHQRGALYSLFAMLANFGILLVPAAMDLYALGGSNTTNMFAESARDLLLLGCVWITLATSLQHLMHSVKEGHRRVSQGVRFGMRLLTSALFFVIRILPWRDTSTYSYDFNPDIMFPLSVVLVQAMALAVDLWSVSQPPRLRQRQHGSSLRDTLLQVDGKGLECKGEDDTAGHCDDNETDDGQNGEGST